MRSTVIRLSILAILLGAALFVKPILLGNAKVVTLQSAPPLSATISQAFTSSGYTTLPVMGKDYRLQNTRYFENGEWVVTVIRGISDKVSDGYVILKQVNGVYLVALGPGSILPSTSTDNLPTDVSQYLNHLGATYEPED